MVNSRIVLADNGSVPVVAPVLLAMLSSMVDGTEPNTQVQFIHPSGVLTLSAPWWSSGICLVASSPDHARTCHAATRHSLLLLDFFALCKRSLVLTECLITAASMWYVQVLWCAVTAGAAAVSGCLLIPPCSALRVSTRLSSRCSCFYSCSMKMAHDCTT